MKTLFLSISISHNEGLNAVLIDQSSIALAIVFMLLFFQAIAPPTDKTTKEID